MKLAVANTFLISLFSFVNRFFVMRTKLLVSIENQISSFLSRVSFVRLGLFAQLRKLYGIKTAFRDLRVDNIAAVPSTYVHNPRNSQQLGVPEPKRVG